MFYRSDTLVEVPGEHADLPTTTCLGDGEICRQTDRWKLRVVGRTSADAQLYIYSSHLRPSDSSADQADRQAAAQMDPRRRGRAAARLTDHLRS